MSKKNENKTTNDMLATNSDTLPEPDMRNAASRMRTPHFEYISERNSHPDFFADFSDFEEELTEDANAYKSQKAENEYEILKVPDDRQMSISHLWNSEIRIGQVEVVTKDIIARALELSPGDAKIIREWVQALEFIHSDRMNFSSPFYPNPERVHRINRPPFRRNVTAKAIIEKAPNVDVNKVAMDLICASKKFEYIKSTKYPHVAVYTKNGKFILRNKYSGALNTNIDNEFSMTFPNFPRISFFDNHRYNNFSTYIDFLIRVDITKSGSRWNENSLIEIIDLQYKNSEQNKEFESYHRKKIIEIMKAFFAAKPITGKGVFSAKFGFDDHGCLVAVNIDLKRNFDLPENIIDHQQTEPVVSLEEFGLAVDDAIAFAKAKLSRSVDQFLRDFFLLEQEADISAYTELFKMHALESLKCSYDNPSHFSQILSSISNAVKTKYKSDIRKYKENCFWFANSLRKRY